MKGFVHLLFHLYYQQFKIINTVNHYKIYIEVILVKI